MRSIIKELNQKQKETEEKKLKKQEEEKNKLLYGQMRLGKCKFEEPEIDLKLSDEITGNLRSLKVRFELIFIYNFNHQTFELKTQINHFSLKETFFWIVINKCKRETSSSREIKLSMHFVYFLSKKNFSPFIQKMFIFSGERENTGKSHSTNETPMKKPITLNRMFMHHLIINKIHFKNIDSFDFLPFF